MMSIRKEFKHLEIQLQSIILATNNFSEDNCIGKGGFGKVYKGDLIISEEQTTVALKRLGGEFGQGDTEFWKEIMMLSRYKHENIVSLLGFCDENGEKILAYKYAPNRSLDLHVNVDDLTWVQRLKICIGAARGLAYLHDPAGNQQRVLHRDIKSSNILIDENWNASIADFGLSKFGPANQQYTFLISRPVGTIGYCDPLYVETGLLTKESDVYSFGVVLFEILCGRLCVQNKVEPQPFTELVRKCYKRNTLDDIIFCNIKEEINPSSLKAFTEIAYQCLKRNRDERPLLNEIVTKLEATLSYQNDVGGISAMDNRLHLQDSVPLKMNISTTHTRIAAERERRTRISESVRNLKKLVPNMDKETKTYAMLNLAVDYIKGLQKDLEVATLPPTTVLQHSQSSNVSPPRPPPSPPLFLPPRSKSNNILVRPPIATTSTSK